MIATKGRLYNSGAYYVYVCNSHLMYDIFEVGPNHHHHDLHLDLQVHSSESSTCKKTLKNTGSNSWSSHGKIMLSTHRGLFSGDLSLFFQFPVTRSKCREEHEREIMMIIMEGGCDLENIFHTSKINKNFGRRVIHNIVRYN